MLVDREGMWFRVLAARYGVDGGRLRDGGRRGSSWWRVIAGIREGGGEAGGGWFGEHVLRRVGDGSDTFFWTDPWVDGIPLCERFGRLYALAETKLCTVAEMSSLGWGGGGEAWAQSSDRWQWQPDPVTGYTVWGAYQLLTTHDSVLMDDAEHLIWHPQVPLKLTIATLDVGWSSRPNTYLSHAALSLVDLEHVGLFCNSFGLLASGLRGRREITDYSEAQLVLLSSYWTRSNFLLTGG
ncbi:hypothetical protein TSUD_84760 [Trifolium subterraneum]|uniref:Reverse transcriptase zinc-binding domain-containing protein n=1 Tax=Trifolium subterraneum TaxID=3900 RepID=A0A2Z6NT92_TRISU|nr:hypothetical protein TSUD_84760 [Trifolium subterraneum]